MHYVESRLSPLGVFRPVRNPFLHFSSREAGGDEKDRKTASVWPKSSLRLVGLLYWGGLTCRRVVVRTLYQCKELWKPSATVGFSLTFQISFLFLIISFSCSLLFFFLISSLLLFFFSSVFLVLISGLLAFIFSSPLFLYFLVALFANFLN